MPAARSWRAKGKAIVLDRPIVTGIVNVTPDSFSDGGRALSADDALALALRLAGEGADVLDIGGESTRPGAKPVKAAAEMKRVIPVIESVRAQLPEMALSVDTTKAEVAAAALAAGADIVNDVSAFRLDPDMAAVCADAGAGVVLMHSRGKVRDMASYAHAEYGPDVTGEVCSELHERVSGARAAGIAAECIVVDPGVGFAKRIRHSRRILRELPRLADLGYPVQVGLSRKRIIGSLSGVAPPEERDAGTMGANVYALLRGASLFRVHDVRSARHALDVAWKLMVEGEGEGEGEGEAEDAGELEERD